MLKLQRDGPGTYGLDADRCGLGQSRPDGSGRGRGGRAAHDRLPGRARGVACGFFATPREHVTGLRRFVWHAINPARRRVMSC